MQEVGIQALWKPEENHWEVTIKDHSCFLDEEEFTFVVDQLRALKIPRGKKANLQIGLGEHVFTLEGLGSIEFVRLKDYFDMCETSYREWKENQ